MALPEDGTPWPPPYMSPVYQQIAIWDTWYGGDPNRLVTLPSFGTRRAEPRQDTFDDELFSTGKIRNFWNEPATPGQNNLKIHVPVAADIAMSSADMLFAEPPQYLFEDDRTTEHFEEFRIESELDTCLLSAAETASALTGAYLYVTWDKTIYKDTPFIATASPDTVVPEFKWSKLVAATIWQCLSEDDEKDVYVRLLTRYEPGFILNAVYLGKKKNLGNRVPLSAYYPDLPEVEKLPKDLLAIDYVPNMAPSRIWRKDPRIAPLGRSDYSGVEQLFSAVDETMSSWMRDIRLGKSRIMVPSSYLQSAGKGQGSQFDYEREVYQPLNIIADEKESITSSQFDIRVEEHEASLNAMIRQILRTSGFSPQTFGEGISALPTATEVNARVQLTEVTRDKKIRYWQDSLRQIIFALLTIANEMFGAKVVPEKPKVIFPPSVKENPMSLATVVKTIEDAKAASTETKVRMLHPEWSDDMVDEEVQKIQDMQPEKASPFGATSPSEPPGATGAPVPSSSPQDGTTESYA